MEECNERSAKGVQTSDASTLAVGKGRERELNEKRSPSRVKLATRGLFHNPLIGGINDAHYWPHCAYQIIVAAVNVAAAKWRV